MFSNIRRLIEKSLLHFWSQVVIFVAILNLFFAHWINATCNLHRTHAICRIYYSKYFNNFSTWIFYWSITVVRVFHAFHSTFSLHLQIPFVFVFHILFSIFLFLYLSLSLSLDINWSQTAFIDDEVHILHHSSLQKSIRKRCLQKSNKNGNILHKRMKTVNPLNIVWMVMPIWCIRSTNSSCTLKINDLFEFQSHLKWISNRDSW